MNLVVFAMRRPITVVMIIVALIGGGILALNQMRVDIFPAINAPQIYVVNNYAGMDPSQIEGIITNVYEQNFQYVDGLKGVESKNIQNLVLLKLTFYPGTDMAAAMSQVVSLSNRARGQMPPSVLPPFVMRFDAANVPIGYLVLESKTRPLGELADLGMYRIRPLLISQIQGTVAFSPFGSNTRAIVITVDPDRLRAHNFSPEDIVAALGTGNVVVPSGNLYVQGEMPLVPTNSMVTDPQEMGNIPIKAGKDVYIRDVATIQDTTDINYGCALVNGRRSIYIPVVKKDTASTLTVVQQINDSMPLFKSVVPEDVDVRYEFDESPTVRTAIKSVATEGLIGALLTGLMILIFLRDLRTVLVVVIGIPLALTAALVGLWLTGNTINIMSLGGLALIHRHSCRYGDCHGREHPRADAPYGFRGPGGAAKRLGHGHVPAAGHALHPLGIHSDICHEGAGAFVVHAADSCSGIRDDCGVSYVELGRAGILRLVHPIQGRRTCRQKGLHRKVSARIPANRI